ncbi:MAG TPA: DNA translocase FtsK, partial [Candidatus Ozemobacteraceae bacterium]|nr:DNA translocase FtsK [Candidatus Ozemobacteraceae bacterium]
LPDLAPLPEENSAVSSLETEIEDPNAPVSLDHHPIDKDLKDLAPSIETEDLEPPRKKIELPPLDLLIVPPAREKAFDSRLNERKERILRTLNEFGIQAEIMDVVEGPVVSRFELKPGPAVKAAKITSLETNLAMNLEATSIRIEAPIYGKNAIGIEIPNPHPQPVFFHDLVKNDCFKNDDTCLNLALGVTIDARPVFADLSDMPHLLIAGSTGSGKSVCVNTIIASILYQATAEQVKMVMIDPKMVELSSYNGIPHLISPVVTDPKKASAALLWAVEEMTRRYSVMAKCEVKKISIYNQELERLRRDVDPMLEPMPFLVIIIDELADLMMTASAEVEGSICRLAQMARAVGMHLVIATQRPSVDVLTGIIKANLPSRIAFAVTSQIDSRTILDTKGAESLLGKGDMLFVPKGKKPIRVQGAYISDRELQNIIAWVKQQGAPNYIDIAPTQEDDDEVEDPAPEEAGGDEDTRLLST